MLRLETMGLGRRKVEVADPRAWVFNRMADVYDARPPYPAALIDALVALLNPPDAQTERVRSRVLDLGAGIGHLALPLAERGHDVVAVEPAIAMLDRLRELAAMRQLAIRALHAKAEQVPLESRSVELVLIADALHFLDAELTAHEIARLLVPGGRLALITCEFADTPFMSALAELMQQAAPRRMRATRQPLVQLAALAGVTLAPVRIFEDSTAVSADELVRILRSISFVGPAMDARRFEAFCAEVRGLPDPAWARRFCLYAGSRR